MRLTLPPPNPAAGKALLRERIMEYCGDGGCVLFFPAAGRALRGCAICSTRLGKGAVLPVVPLPTGDGLR